MTEPEILKHIGTLQGWLEAAWRRLGDPALTTFERRELRNNMKQADLALRRYLVLVSELKLKRQTQVRPDARAFTKPELKFLA